MKDVSKYLRDGTTEAFIPYEAGDEPSIVSRRVKSYCFHFGVIASTETIYGANSKGEGFRFLHITLDKAIERKYKK